MCLLRRVCEATLTRRCGSFSDTRQHQRGYVSFPARVLKLAAGCALSRPVAYCRFMKCTRRVAHLLEQRRIGVKVRMAGGIGLVIAHILVEQGDVARGTKMHVREPVGQHAMQVLSPGAVAMNNDGEAAVREVAGIVPALLELLCALGILALRTTGIRVAAVGTHHSVHHRLESRGRLVPVHRTDDHDAVRRDPQRIDVVHPVMRLAERVIRITAARPMAECHRGRDA